MIGNTIKETYRIDEEIGRGGMSRVYKAWDLSLRRWVAIKVTKEGFGSLTQREGWALGQLPHAHIVNVFARFEDDGRMLTVMEFIEGQPLSEVAALPLGEALTILGQVLEALKFAHSKKVIHRDLKPANIMIRRDGDGSHHAKVLDFGIAKIQNPEGDETVTVGPAGTLYYMSPEQILASKELDHRTDIYSLGKTFYEIFAGRLPFEKGSSSNFEIQKQIIERKFKPPSHYNSRLPREIDQLIAKAIEKKPERRYQSAGEMLDRVEYLKSKFADGDHNATPDVTRRDWLDFLPSGMVESSDAFPWKKTGLALIGIFLLVLLGVGVNFALKSINGPEAFGQSTDGTDDNEAVYLVPEDTSAGIEDLGGGPQSTNGSDNEPVLPEQQIGYLRINSNPSNALVEFVSNGNLLTLRTPVESQDVPSGAYTIRFTMDGYFPQTQEAAVESGQLKIVSAKLVPFGTLAISGDTDAEIWIDGASKGRIGNRRFDLATGKYDIHIRKNGFKERSFSVDIAHGRTTRQHVELEPEITLANLRLRVRPRGHIIVDNETVASNAEFWEGPLRPQSYKVMAIYNGVRWDSTVVLKNDQDITFDFTDLVPITVYIEDSTKPSSEVIVDGVSIELNTPARFDLSPGYHEIFARDDRSGYRTETKRILLHAGERYTGRYEIGLQ